MQNHFSRLPPKSVARQEALWQDTLREGSVRALCQGREYNSSGHTCHLKEAVRARNSIVTSRFEVPLLIDSAKKSGGGLIDHPKALLQVELPEGLAKFKERVSTPDGIHEDVQFASFLRDPREQRLDRARTRVVDHGRDPDSSPRRHALRGLLDRFQPATQVKKSNRPASVARLVLAASSDPCIRL